MTGFLPESLKAIFVCGLRRPRGEPQSMHAVLYFKLMYKFQRFTLVHAVLRPQYHARFTLCIVCIIMHNYTATSNARKKK